MITTGPFTLALNTVVDVPDPLASSGGPSVANLIGPPGAVSCSRPSDSCPPTSWRQPAPARSTSIAPSIAWPTISSPPTVPPTPLTPRRDVGRHPTPRVVARPQHPVDLFQQCLTGGRFMEPVRRIRLGVLMVGPRPNNTSTMVSLTHRIPLPAESAAL